MTKPLKPLLLRAEWGGRFETTEQIAARIWDTLTLFEGLGGLYNRSFCDVSDYPLVRPLSGDRAAIEEAVDRGIERDAHGATLVGTGTSFSTIQNITNKLTPYVDLALFAGNQRDGARNRIIATFKKNVRSIPEPEPSAIFPVETDLYPHAVHLVKEFTRIWNAEAVSLDSNEAIKLNPPLRRDVRRATVGYLTWLSDTIAPDLSSVTAAQLERYRNGTLLLTELGTDHMVEDVATLIDQTHGAGLLHPIPTLHADNFPYTP